MKTIIATVLTMSVFSMSAYGYSQVDRIQDMQTMESAMAEIQKGILYNNKKMVLEGVDKLKKASSSVEVTSKDYMDYSASFAKAQSKNIRKYAEKIKENIEAGKKHGATTNYTNVLGECVSCHNKLRKWN